MNNCKCVVCGTEFYQTPYRIQNGRGKFCSTECYRISTKPAMQTVSCVICGKQFEEKIHRIASGRGKYCSQQCKGKSTAKEIVCKITENGCHEVVSHIGKEYPSVHRNGKAQGLHRYVYEKNFGKIPDNMLVCHKCDNPKCCNPEHLFLGTIADNNKDAFNKIRHTHGEMQGSSKLTELNVLYIRSSSETGRELAIKFNVSESTISSARKGDTWKHI